VAVYDGHGGERAAKYVEAHLHKNILSSAAFKAGDVEEAYRVGFRQTDQVRIIEHDFFFFFCFVLCVCLLSDL
jgi:serine/threonine protein phosphatase PrpC